MDYILSMGSLMCQLDWDTEPKYLANHYYKCFCESIFLIGLAFKSVDFE